MLLCDILKDENIINNYNNYDFFFKKISIYDLIFYIYFCKINIKQDILDFLILQKINENLSLNIKTEKNFINSLSILSKKIIMSENILRFFIVLYYDYKILRSLLLLYKKLDYFIYLRIPSKNNDKTKIIKFCLLNNIKIDEKILSINNINLNFEKNILKNFPQEIQREILLNIF